MAGFAFATGIENSYPVIQLPDGSRKRVDEMAKTGHYARWRDDFNLVLDLGIRYLRYGPPYYSTHLGPGRYDWDFADEVFAAMRERQIVPIVDLCHFGVPDWVGSFQNPDWPEHFAAYARAFAQRFPWVNLYTPVNEIYIAALFSAQYGWWNECLTTDRAFVTALTHLCRANTLAMHAIMGVNKEPVFIQSESSEYYHAQAPAQQSTANFLNDRRFLALDLTYGHPVDAFMYEYLLDNGMTREQYHWFRDRRVKANCVMGNDYYVTNEHMVHEDSSTSASGEVFGYYLITREYYDRYELPLMHTETNHNEPDAVSWLHKQWANMRRLRHDGVPILGFTWYSLIDQVDWDTALRCDDGHINPLGLADLDRKLRPVGEAYRHLIRQWRDILPTESITLGMQW